jgi:two-component system, NtrC family, response regulator AtoC
VGTTLKTFDGRLISCQALPPKETIFGDTEGMKGLWQIAEKVAGASVPILIVGEKGTGKEILARFIHSCNPASSALFLKLNSQFPDSHAGTEVAFRLDPAGADGREEFHGNGNSGLRPCTLFVDEVSESDPAHQLELLRLIQGSRPFISSDGRDVPVSLRVIGTSSHDLERKVAAGSFREDLFSALSVVTLRVPPLRERKEDIPGLASYFWRTYSERFGCQPEPPSRELVRRLQLHDWPGNIRELENVMKRYVVLGTEGIKGIGYKESSLRPVAYKPSSGHSVSLKDLTREATQALERKIILQTLQETQWNRRRTARALNISYRALLYKIKAAGLLPEASDSEVEAHSRESLKLDHNAAA